jgi:hypothetical protein
VIGVTTSGNPNEIKKWFRSPYNTSGSYELRGSQIRFTLTAPEGTVDYDGVVNGNFMRVKVLSHINGYSHEKEYQWVAPRRQKR